jgi:hypothetical protein
MILQPLYEFLKPNESVLVKKIKASVSVRGKIYEEDAEVYLDFLPRAKIHIYASIPQMVLLKDIETLAIAGKDIPGFATGATFSSSEGKAEIVWCPKMEPVIGYGDQNTQMVTVVFHLFNYIDFFGNRNSMEQTEKESHGTKCVIQHSIRHLDIKTDGWDVELKTLKTSADTFKILTETGGYCLTHVGRLQKEDRTSFDGKTAEELLTALHFFLSFSRGMWCNPCLAVGFDDKENRVWETWASPRGHWGSPSSWFDPHHCEQLANLFPGFMAKWGNEDWREALQEVIYWYLNSNCSSLGIGIGIGAGIILTQTAIERLSFEYAVRHKKLVGADGFKDLRASDKFRLLFSSLDIPIDIPASLPELQGLAKQFKWLDAPHAITEVRNSLVHPEHKRSGQFDEAFYPVWNLGQWYLELALLRICDYSGTYGNRLVQRWIGEVETVP